VAAGYLECFRNAPPGSAGDRGKRLLDLQRLDQWGLFPLKSFWPLLDERSQRAYAAAVESDFAALPPPSAESGPISHWAADVFVVDRMEQLATVQGDVDLLIRVFSRGLERSGYAYEQIVEVCRKAGRAREATQWAERGYRHHPEKNQAAWQRLKHATRDEWHEYRRCALEHAERQEPTGPDGRRNVSTRLVLLLADGDLDQARALAERHTASPQVLESLPRALVATQPVSAAALMRRVIDATLLRAMPKHYPAIVAQISEVSALDSGPETRAWIGRLKQQHRAKRKLMALLGGAV
jgi:hypothetical protein